jgi:hypothetical protein
VPRRKRDNQFAMQTRQRARGHDKTAVRTTRKCAERALNLAGVSYIEWMQFHTERRRHGLDPPN